MEIPNDGERETWLEMPLSLSERIARDRGPEARQTFDKELQHRLSFYADNVAQAEAAARGKVRRKYPPLRNTRSQKPRKMPCDHTQPTQNVPQS